MRIVCVLLSVDPFWESDCLLVVLSVLDPNHRQWRQGSCGTAGGGCPLLVACIAWVSSEHTAGRSRLRAASNSEGQQIFLEVG